MSDFLLELTSEEIPARMQLRAKADLAALFESELAKAGLAARAIEAFATPRRIALIAHGLPLHTEARVEEIKGPKVTAPAQAIDGFLRKTGLTKDALVERDGVWFALTETPGKPTAAVLAQAIPAIVRGFPWPKSMRWGAASASTESLRWVRPLTGIVALLGEDVVACEVDSIVSGRETVGHRFHASGPVSIASPAAYVETLRAVHVIVHFSERCAIIRDGAARLARDAGLHVIDDEGLVTENAGLTEWPVPMLGAFDPAFLAVPPEVIQLSARVNQKYFTLRSGDGALAPNFVCTANIAASDGGAAVIAGNERVLSARLSDAKFFWEQDLKIPLDEQAKKLSQIVFHEKLGSVADKVERVARLARWLCEEGIISASLPDARGSALASPLPQAGGDGGGSVSAGLPADAPTPNPSRTREGDITALAEAAERAARLCKADLVTGMVGEFPELQGLIGGYLARAQGEPGVVADAIRDHYKPVGQGDDVPTAPVTVAVSLADKLDTLAAFFWGQMPPTGSKDPFALRRAALAVISILDVNNVRLPLTAPLMLAINALLLDSGDSIGTLDQDAANDVIPDLLSFFADRLKVQQREAGVRHDLIDAVFALGDEDDLVRLLARVKALQAFVTTEEGTNLLAGYKRAANILKAAEKSSPSSLREDSQLQAAIDAAEPLAAAAIAREDFEAAMAALASLREAVDAFFDGVMVNDPDPDVRAYRLGLLARFRDAVHKVADFSKIEG